MLQLKNIKKKYGNGENQIEVLKGINTSFRDNEFVSILGPSGCGKTTMLNIIGGLDQYSSGDLLVEGKSTKTYRDGDWDAYRNTTIGFVFQNYNLINHLSLLDNVEMALSLSGSSKHEKREKALNALKRVGLEGHTHKRPNQLSGGQMQRVAIARALVTDPKVLLADEPTGALDSKTSKKVMKLIQDISKDRLVIMVTHNAKIAEQFSDRIIKLLDGEVIEDSNPVQNQKNTSTETLKQSKKPSMSLLAALKSSFNNLFTKKGRTIITAIAGSIGIIGIAAVLALSNGIKTQIADIQEDQFSNMPVSLTRDYFDFSVLFDMNREEQTIDNDEDKVYIEDTTNFDGMHKNIFTADFINHLETMDSTKYKEIEYLYNTPVRFIQKTENNIINDVRSLSKYEDTEDFDNNYNLLSGTLPTNNKEVVLVLDKNNQISQTVIEDLGLSFSEGIEFDAIIGKSFKVITNNALLKKEGDIFVEEGDKEVLYNDSNSIELTLTGIVKAKSDLDEDTEVLYSGIYYNESLYNELYQNSLTSDVVVYQKEHSDINVLTGFAFDEMYTYDGVIYDLGGSESPEAINIYPVDINSQKYIQNHIDEFNKGKNVEDKILYSDAMEDLTKEISKVINTITIVLSAIAGVSLVVSSLMIGIITYVSVIERTKEIGIMRSLGARKKDISRIFNAETFIIGLASGLLGVIIVLILSIPANAVIYNLSNIHGLIKLPILGALGLIALSTFLTLLSGLIPSRIAARKDPVEALRTE